MPSDLINFHLNELLLAEQLERKRIVNKFNISNVLCMNNRAQVKI